MVEGIVIDIEGVESQINGKVLEVDNSNYSEEWLTINAINSAYSSLTTISENFNDTIADFSTFLTSLKDNESANYIPDIIGNRTSSNLLDREEAIGNLMLSNSGVTRAQAETIIDNESRYADYGSIARKYGSSLEVGAKEQIDDRWYADSKNKRDRAIAIEKYMQAYPDSSREVAEQQVDYYYSEGNEYVDQLDSYDREIENNKKITAGREDVIYNNSSPNHQSNQIDQRETAVERFMQAYPGWTRESAEQRVDEFYSAGHEYVDQLDTYNRQIEENNNREIAVERFMQAYPDWTRESAEQRVDQFYSEGNEYVDQLNTYDWQIEQNNKQTAAGREDVTYTNHK